MPRRANKRSNGFDTNSCSVLNVFEQVFGTDLAAPRRPDSSRIPKVWLFLPPGTANLTKGSDMADQAVVSAFQQHLAEARQLRRSTAAGCSKPHFSVRGRQGRRRAPLRPVQNQVSAAQDSWVPASSVRCDSRQATGHSRESTATSSVTRLRRFLVASSLVLVALGTIGVVGAGTGSGAADEGSSQLVTSVVVQQGDTYWSIARDLDPSGDIRPLVADLQEANSNQPLVPGQRLSIPK